MTYRPIFSGDHIVLIDGSALLYRAYFSNTKELKRSDGTPTGALFGVVQSLWYMLAAPAGIGGSPTHAIVLFDTPARTHRHEMSEAYKAHRSAAPSDLTAQRPLVYDAIAAFGLRETRADGWEADDLIATYSARAKDAGARVSIIGNDKDLLTLVDDNVTVRYRDKGQWHEMDERAVIEKWGVEPKMLPDLLAIADDVSDGVRGIPGLGTGIGKGLIQRFGTLDNVLEQAPHSSYPGLGPSRRNAIRDYAARARLAREMILLRFDAPMPIALEECGVDFNPARVITFCEEAEFPGFIERIKEWQASP
jgi:DNA polymerase-1